MPTLSLAARTSSSKERFREIAISDSRSISSLVRDEARIFASFVMLMTFWERPIGMVLRGEAFEFSGDNGCPVWIMQFSSSASRRASFACSCITSRSAASARCRSLLRSSLRVEITKTDCLRSLLW